MAKFIKSLQEMKKYQFGIIVGLFFLLVMLACVLQLLPGDIFDNPKEKNETQTLQYVINFYQAYYYENNRYPDNINIISNYIPIDNTLLSNIKVKFTEEEVIYSSSKECYKEAKGQKIHSVVGETKDESDISKTNIPNIMMLIIYIILISILLLIYVIMRQYKIAILTRIGCLILFVVLNLFFIKYDISKLNFRNEYYSEIFNIKAITTDYLKNKDIPKALSSGNNLHVQHYIINNNDNTYILSQIKGYYAQCILLPYDWIDFEWRIGALNSIDILVYDLFTGTYFIQYGYFKNFRFRDKVYLAIFAESFKRFSIAMIIILIFTFITQVRRKSKDNT